MHSMSTKFGVDSSSRFPFKAPTDRQSDSLHKVTDTTGHPTLSPAWLTELRDSGPLYWLFDAKVDEAFEMFVALTRSTHNTTVTSAWYTPSQARHFHIDTNGWGTYRQAGPCAHTHRRWLDVARCRWMSEGCDWLMHWPIGLSAQHYRTSNPNSNTDPNLTLLTLNDPRSQTINPNLSVLYT